MRGAIREGEPDERQTEPPKKRGGRRGKVRDSLYIFLRDCYNKNNRCIGRERWIQ